ncbi:uncharacterized protein K441DRAFT_668364 [Cenococcum geophilum 1.58]|uniref:uncharacterized protein n=1 Tax=Cenococcum geophilum 1.58 TaxID=794803 RepID=UPI00358F369C|nr:hypothetical protein K441DRAFT_668364 [Cenococcum geophilum 1.58]
MELLASFQYGARSSCYRFQFNMEASYLHTSVQPVEPQTRVKSGRNAFFVPDFQFIFNLTVLQPNNPKTSRYGQLLLPTLQIRQWWRGIW